MLFPHSPVPVTEKFPTPVPHVQVVSMTRELDGVLWPDMCLEAGPDDPLYRGNAHAEAERAGITHCTSTSPSEGALSWQWALPLGVDCPACEAEEGHAVMVVIAPMSIN